MKTFKQLLNEGIDDFIKQKNLKDHINPALMKEVIITLNKRDYKVNIGALLTPYLNTKSDFNIFTLNKTDKIIVDFETLKELCVSPFDKEFNCSYEQENITIKGNSIKGKFKISRPSSVKESLSNHNVFEAGGDDGGILGNLGTIAMMACYSNPMLAIGLSLAAFICATPLAARGMDWLGDKIFGSKDKDKKDEKGEKDDEEKSGGFGNFMNNILAGEKAEGGEPSSEDKERNLLKTLTLVSAKAKETGDESLTENFNTFLGSITKEDGSIDMEGLGKAVESNKEIVSKIEDSVKNNAALQQFAGGADGVKDEDISNLQEQAKNARAYTQKKEELTKLESQYADLEKQIAELEENPDSKEAVEQLKKQKEDLETQKKAVETAVSDAKNACNSASDKISSSLKNNPAVTGQDSKADDKADDKTDDKADNKDKTDDKADDKTDKDKADDKTDKDKYYTYDEKEGDFTKEYIKKEKDENGEEVYKKYKKNDKGEDELVGDASKDDFDKAKTANDEFTDEQNKKTENEVEDADGNIIVKEPDPNNPDEFIYTKHKKGEDGKPGEEIGKASKDDFDDASEDEGEDDAKEQDGDDDATKSAKKNPAKIWHRKKKKNGTGSTKNYYNSEGESISAKEYKEKLKAFKSHKRKQTQESRLKVRSNLKEARIRTLKDLRRR